MKSSNTKPVCLAGWILSSFLCGGTVGFLAAKWCFGRCSSRPLLCDYHKDLNVRKEVDAQQTSKEEVDHNGNGE